MTYYTTTHHWTSQEDTRQRTKIATERRLPTKYAMGGLSKKILITSIVIVVLSVIAIVSISTSASNQISSLRKELSKLKKEKSVLKPPPASSATLNLSQKFDTEIKSIRRRIDEDLADSAVRIHFTDSLLSDRLTQLEMLSNASSLSSKLTFVEQDLINKTQQLKNDASSLSSKLTQLNMYSVNNTQQIQSTGQTLEQAEDTHHKYLKEWFSCYYGGNVTHIINPYTGTCLFTGQRLVDWPTAQWQCKSRGGKLAVVFSTEELGWLTEFRLKSTTHKSWKEDFWIGLRDLNGWRWVGRVKGPVSADDVIWDKPNVLLPTSQPTRSDGTTCGFMRYWFSNRISDMKCSNIALYLCEVE